MVDFTIVLVNVLWASVVGGAVGVVYYYLRTFAQRRDLATRLEKLEDSDRATHLAVETMAYDFKYVRGELEKLKAVPSKQMRL